MQRVFLRILPILTLAIGLVSYAYPQERGKEGMNHQHDMGGHSMNEIEGHVMTGHDMSNMAGMQKEAPLSPAQLAKLEADKRFSEFNHRFAGLFVVLAAIVVFVEPKIAARFAGIRYLWAAFFFIPGAYLLFLSDPESWPTGDQTLWYVITVNHQVLQHKIFAIIMLALGIVEFLRVHYEMRSPCWVAPFPVLAASGAALLLFHAHPIPKGLGMMASEHLAMMKIEKQHLGFSIAGFGIAVSKAVVDLGKFHPKIMRPVFALLMATLGGLLIAYTE